MQPAARPARSSWNNKPFFVTKLRMAIKRFQREHLLVPTSLKFASGPSAPLKGKSPKGFSGSQSPGSNRNRSTSQAQADWNRFGDPCRLYLDDSVTDIEQFTSKLLGAARSSIPFHKGTKCKTRLPRFTQEYDFAIYAEGKHLQDLERTIQRYINNVQKWVSESGFRFSVSKTTCVHFHRQRIYTEPTFHLDGQQIPVKGEAKFLAAVFDSKLNCNNHVTYLKKKCLNALNLLRVVGHTDWGADRATLLKLYRKLVRSKLDYGSVIYGSAKKHVLRGLDPIHHQGLRIALGTIRTSPIKSLYAEAGEPPLEHRRSKLAFKDILKLQSLPRNPCHDVVFEAQLSDFSVDSKSEPNLIANTFEHIKNAKINLNTIDNLHVQCPPPWEKHKVNVDISLTDHKKENTSEVAYQKDFFRIKEKFSNHYAVALTALNWRKRLRPQPIIRSAQTSRRQLS
ncbi:Pol-like protein [Plakobranchus ocellatus]|uniref:Pol-like protein n=1 Tax=Plakobranchus ocellatus TaxID=259542 RepID=A0AAV3ZG81_9GAST|nr:Pol-like protein [Plakobranchus ocellatus]